MKLLVVGNMGYVGPVLVKHLRRAYPMAELIGFDSGFFAHCLTAAPYWPENNLDLQIFGDVRRIPDTAFDGVDSVIHLAAVSNDPMGNRFESVTADINAEAVIRTANVAKACGVKSFVFASSCSIYGCAADGSPRKENDSLNPLTAYAKSKVAAEVGLKKVADDHFTVTALRFSTACGMSDRLRLDLVLNDFVACAIAASEITVMSDGTPWRPLIHVKDMSLAMEWALGRQSTDGGSFLVMNVGSASWNLQVGELATAVASAIPETRVSINKAAPPDKRSYRVDFSLFKKMAPNHQPKVTLEDAIKNIFAGLTAMKFSDRDFRTSQMMRLKVLENHIRIGILNEQLEWAPIQKRGE